MRVNSVGLSAFMLLLVPVLPASANEAAGGAEASAPVMVEHLLSMSIDGTILIDTDGSVRDYALTTKVLPEIGENLGKAIRNWRFEPVQVDAQPARQEARMRISLAATQVGKDYQVRVDNVVFRPMATASPADAHNDPSAAIQAERRKLDPPKYPVGLMRQGIGGRVLVALHFSPEGKILEAVPVQSMLFDTRGKDRDLARAIKMFEDATIRATRDWLVDVKIKPGVPTTAKDFTTFTTVEYVMDDSPGFSRKTPYVEPSGQWRMVARTPKQIVPWLLGLDAPDVGVADLRNGEMASLSGDVPKLKSPVVNTLL
jgi:hypothetical protein